MAKIIDFGSHLPPRDDPPRTRNREILDRIEAMVAAADTPQARLLSELRGLEETLLANHRQYARLWEAAEQLGIDPPVATPADLVERAGPPTSRTTNSYPRGQKP